MYIKVVNGQAVPYSRRQLQADNFNVSFPQNIKAETLAEYNVFPLTQAQAPNADIVTKGPIELINGAWIQTYVGRDYTDEEKRSQMVVTARQARLALASVGKLTMIADAIALIPEPDKTQVAIEWEYATTIERTSPWIETMRPALGLSEEEMDQLFVQAAEL